MGPSRRRRATTAATYKLCSLLLQYPDDELIAARDDIAGAVAELPRAAATTALERFCAWWAAAEPLEIEQHYVATFDLHKRSGLYLTFYGEGDRRERGVAMLRLRKLYRAAGLPQADGELPDFLPLMLEFAAAAPPGYGETVLREHRAALELLRLSLRDHGSPYADVADAVGLTLGEASAAERAKVGLLAAAGPPQELVGLEPFAPPEVMPSAQVHR